MRQWRKTMACGVSAIALLGAAGVEWDDARLRPFVIEHRTAGPFPADLTRDLDAPAGKHGFVQIRDGHLAGGDGKRIRFWGVHFTDWSRGSVMLPPKEDAPVWAASLARHGINCVRLHFIDLFAPRGIVDNTKEDSRSFDAGQLDRLDFLVAELKKRGIYVNLNLNVGRSYKAGDGVEGHDKIRWGKGLVLFDPKLIELQKEYARMILTHRNPYTGLEYRSDPAVAIVEILNENALYMGFRAPTPYYDEQLTRLYNDWLTKTQSPAALAALRKIAGVAEDAPVPRLIGPGTSAAPRERFAAEMAFYMQAEDRFYQDMAAYLRKDLGVRVPITGTADHSHSGSSYPMLSTLSRLDIMDGHSYWQHPGSRTVNTPMVNEPLNSTVVRLSRTAVAGKPYTASEVNHPFPNDYGSEGIPILAAYGALQDWDGIFLYTFEPKTAADWKGYVGDPFDISHDPVRMTQMATGSLLFRRGDVRAAKTTVARSYTAEQVLDSRKLPPSETPYFTPGFPHALPLTHASRIRSLAGAPTEIPTLAETDPIRSDTGELAWHRGEGRHGVVTIDTPRSQALIGFLAANRQRTKHLSAALQTGFAALALSSLDGKPVARAERLLLTAGSRVTNTGMKWNDAGTRLAQQGGPPSLIEPVRGDLRIEGLEKAKTVSLQALDGGGRPLGPEQAARQSDSAWTIELGTTPTTWYLIKVTR